MAAYLQIAGLVLTLAGAAMASRGVLISDAQAQSMAATKWGSNQKLKAALLRQSRLAACGLALVAIGTILQIVAIVQVR